MYIRKFESFDKSDDRSIPKGTMSTEIISPDVVYDYEYYGVVFSGRFRNAEVVNGRINIDGDIEINGRRRSKKTSSLPIKFGHINGNFIFINNLLTNLEGFPISVSKDFSCVGNKLTSLEGAPNSVGGDFYCYNNNLTSLEGAPNSVGGGFYCNNNKIIDFKVPEFSLNEEKVFICNDNPIYQIYSLFNTPKCIDLINEYSAVQGDKVIWDRLVEVYHSLNIPIPNTRDITLNKFKIIL